MSKNSRNRSRLERMKAALVNDGRVESCGDRTLVAVEQYLESKGMSVFRHPERDFITLDLTFFPPERVTYRNEDDETTCELTIHACEERHCVWIASPDAWSLGDCPHRAAVFESLVRMMPGLPLVHFLYDAKSDGITPFAIVPIGDRGVSGDSILDGIARIINAILEWDPAIRRAMATGEVSVPDRPGSGEELSPDEKIRISHGLINQLNKEVEARWQRVRKDRVEKTAGGGPVAMPEQPQGDYLMGTAAIVHGGCLLALTPTLLARFEEVETRVMSALAKRLGL